MRKQGAFTQESLWEICHGREMGIWLKQRDRGPVLQKVSRYIGIYLQWNLEVCS